MKKIIIYSADDGTRFDYEKDCIEYEKQMITKEKRRNEIIKLDAELKKIKEEFMYDFEETWEGVRIENCGKREWMC